MEPDETHDDGQRLYSLLALFDTRDGSPLAGGMGGCGGTHTDCYYRSILSVAISRAEEAR